MVARAFWGTSVGYFFPTLWCLGIGCLLALARNIGAPEEIPAAVAAGSAGILALLALTVDESDEAFADIYSWAVSAQNLWPRAPQRLLIAVVAVVSALLALVVTVGSFELFLFLIGREIAHGPTAHADAARG